MPAEMAPAGMFSECFVIYAPCLEYICNGKHCYEVLGMFIYSVKASTLKFAAIVVVGIAVFLALFIFIPPTEDGVTQEVSISYENVKTDEGRRAFLSSLGYELGEGEAESVKIRIPAEFDKIYAGYNEMQKLRGFDLAKYKNREVERYTYTVTNYEGYEGVVYANLLVYRGKVIGGDVCSADSGGFCHALEKI